MANDKLRIIPLGGLGEFGMNCMAVEWGNDILVIDAGLMFPEEELLGVDIVVPDIVVPDIVKAPTSAGALTDVSKRSDSAAGLGAGIATL